MAKKKRTRKASDRDVHSNFWGMVQIVLITAINKGQLPAAGLTIVAIVLAVKIPPQEIGKIVSQLFDMVVLGNFVGYILFLMTLLLWYLHNKRERHRSETELRRVSWERDKFQRLVLGDKLIESSED